MKHFICGSGWKMVNGYQDSIRIARELQEKLKDFHDYPVVIFPSFPVIPEIKASKSGQCGKGGGPGHVLGTGRCLHW